MMYRFPISTRHWLLAAICAAPCLVHAAPLRITTEHSPPASMLENGVVIGRETDKVREMMARTNTAYSIEQLPWKRAFTLAQHEANTCVYSTSRTPDRDRLFKWVGPTDEADWELWGRADHSFPLRSLEDARGLRIGTSNGDARDEYLRSRGYKADPVSNDLINPHKLLMNRIDLWAVARRPASPLPRYDWSDQIVPLLVFNRVKVYLACNPSVPDALIARLNATLEEMRRDGTMSRLEKKYEHWNSRK